ncbi:MAG TPA: M50 family metallopeptidase [Bacteroidales bacterium]|nr:M50 family metallopeptidase [Bacteroidales bacterium]
MEENHGKKKSLWKSLIFIWIAGTALGLGLAVSDADLSFMENIGFFDLPIMFVLFFIGVFLVINIHELGHLIVGKLLGYEFLMFRAGIFSVHKENGRLRFSLVRNVGYGGLCAMLPKGDSDLKDFAVYSTGGIIFNIITGILFILAPGYFSLPGVFSVPLYGTGLVSVILALINAWPFFSMNQPTDGMMFYSIMKNSPLAERFYESAMLSQKLVAGTRPRELILEMPDLPIEDHLELMKILYLYFMALDKGEVPLAGEYIAMVEENLGKVPPYTLPVYYYEIIYYSLITGNLVKAMNYHEKAGNILKNDRDINGLRIKAYYAYHVEKDEKKALKLANEGIAVMEKYPFRGQAVFEEEQLEKLIALIVPE